MSPLETTLGILALALVTALLYVWGLRKSMTQASDLDRILMNKCAGKVVKYLKSHSEINLSEMARLCQGVKAGQFWSRNRAAVQNSKAFAQKLAQYMVEQQLLEPVSNNRFRRHP